MITDANKTQLSSNTPGTIWVNCWGMPDTYHDINDKLPIRKINDNGESRKNFSDCVTEYVRCN